MRATYVSRSVFQPNLGINQQLAWQEQSFQQRSLVDKDLAANDRQLTQTPLPAHLPAGSKDSASSTVSDASRQEAAEANPILERDQVIIPGPDVKNQTRQAGLDGQDCIQEERFEQCSELASAQESNRSSHLLAENLVTWSGKQDQDTGSDAMDEEATFTPGEALLCIVEGQDKENISPVKILIDEQLKVQAAVDSPNPQHLMDEDKEPVFAEENLDKTQPMFDDPPSQQKTDAKAESPISERKTMIVASPSIKQAQRSGDLLTKSSQVRLSSQKKIAPSNLSFKPNQPQQKPATPNHKTASRALDLNIKSRQQVTTLTPSKSKDILKPKTSNTPRTTELKSMSPALQKRPPVFEKKENLHQPPAIRSPISSIALQKDKIKARLYQTVTKTSTEISRLPKPQTPVAAATEKHTRHASVTRLHKSPSSKQRLLSDTDSKLCPEIAARQAEAERVLLQKKPPIPKFHFQPRGDSKLKQSDSPAELPRKPAVPKLSELMRRRSGL